MKDLIIINNEKVFDPENGKISTVIILHLKIGYPKILIIIIKIQYIVRSSDKKKDAKNWDLDEC